MASYEEMIQAAKNSCPELGELPPGWSFDFATKEDNRIFFIRDGKKDANTFNHPSRGPLPKNWVLKLVKFDDGIWKTIYYNRETREKSRQDIRNRETPKADKSKDLWGASSSVVVKSQADFENFQREPVLTYDVENRFKLVHAIDAGDGTLGQFNGGVFVVKLAEVPGKLFIQKKFKADKSSIDMAKTEIKLLRKCMHYSLTSYHAAFIDEKSLRPSASLYIEFCDRGSLRDLLEQYSKRRNDREPPTIPEAFIWHVFIGLMDGLAYLQTGRYCLSDPQTTVKSGWTPVLHRDIKPDNVLLRSRSTPGSKKYFYCIISDFGLACENPKVYTGYQHPDSQQRHGTICGTPVYLAPELNHYPYAKNSHQQSYFPKGQFHTSKSDAWAVGACVYSLAQAPNANVDLCHIDMKAPPNVDPGIWMAGLAAKHKVGELKPPPRYTEHLKNALLYVTRENPIQRPEPAVAIKELQRLNKLSGWTHYESSPPLPEWATRTHEYFSMAERMR
ncbi:Protein kinase-like (PK-like) [Glarea lozoyensis ATCC 20868]|uniref:non-specific serine/threonine protein kinase n=1 Tax=Glarea lozoyensis (strain ATCC 20868 / MF5171) TaxID=1116229 RepID=S3CQ31_GLAL2|nr:Protein kinase-like (PK-like) [Glarea lozoyensis ATCC 20868]EPE27244.1 Protein kinase-like (PK-like) [Glarea lozoyensis ATCC 20868]